MGSKTQQTTSNQTYGPPAYIQNAYQGLISKAQNTADTAYNPATNAQVAGFNPQQTQAFGEVGAAQGVAQPYIGQATNYANQAAGPISSNSIQSYENPYTQGVINSTLANIQGNNAIQQQQLSGNAAAQGALGGDRQAVAQSELARQQNMATNQTISGLESQNYSQALGAAQQDAARQGQAAFTLGNLGNEAQSTAYTDANQLARSGATQQQQQQNEYNASTANAKQQQQYPFQEQQWLAGIETGLGSTAGGTSTGTQTTPGPNLGSQLLGAGLTAASFFADGGKVEDYASAAPADPHFMTLAHKVRHAIKAIKPHAGVHIFHHFDDGGAVFSDGEIADASNTHGMDGVGAPETTASNPFFSKGQSSALKNEGSSLMKAGAAPQIKPQQMQVPHSSPVHIAPVLPYGSAGVSGFAEGGDVDASNGLPEEVPLPESRIDAFGQSAPLPDNMPLPDQRPGADDIAILNKGGSQPSAAPKPAPASAPATSTGSSFWHNDHPLSSALGLDGEDRRSLRAAGLGMMASKSPFFGTAVGEGGMAGIGQYDKEREIAAKAKQLAMQAAQHQQSLAHQNAALAETTRHNQVQEGMGRWDLRNVTDADGHEHVIGYDRRSGETKDVGLSSVNSPAKAVGDVTANAQRIQQESPKDENGQPTMTWNEALNRARKVQGGNDSLELRKRQAADKAASDPLNQFYGKPLEAQKYFGVTQTPAPQAQAAPATPQAAIPPTDPRTFWQKHAPETLGGQNAPTTTTQPNPFQAKPALPQGVTPQMALEQARAAIASGRNKAAVIQRLQGLGIDASGL